MLLPPPRSPLFPYTTLFRSRLAVEVGDGLDRRVGLHIPEQVAGAGDLGADDAHRRALRIGAEHAHEDRKSTRLNSSHVAISYAVFCLKKKKKKYTHIDRSMY